MAVKSISQKLLRDTLNYNPLTGIFTRIKKNSSPDSVAGWRAVSGYIEISVCGRRFYAHRLAFVWMTGEMPRSQVDHKNGNRSDNCWENLRLATPVQNHHNERKPRKQNKSGFLGVCKSAFGFIAYISINGRTKYLGSYRTPKLAHAAYLKEKRMAHEFCTL